MKNAVGVLLTLAGWAIVAGPGPARAAGPATGWKAGVARVDTTPTEPVRMAGYASRTSPSQGVAHPLAAKALALADSEGHRVVIVTCDIIDLRRPLSGRIARRVEAEHGLPRADLVLFASHTHAGPQLVDPDEPAREGFEANVAYTRVLEDKLVGVIGTAIARMAPADLKAMASAAPTSPSTAASRPRPGSSSARTPPVRPTRACQVLRVLDADGKPLAHVVFGCACHNTTLRPDHTMKIDPDFKPATPRTASRPTTPAARQCSP